MAKGDGISRRPISHERVIVPSVCPARLFPHRHSRLRLPAGLIRGRSGHGARCTGGGRRFHRPGPLLFGRGRILYRSRRGPARSSPACCGPSRNAEFRLLDRDGGRFGSRRSPGLVRGDPTPGGPSRRCRCRVGGYSGRCAQGDGPAEAAPRAGSSPGARGPIDRGGTRGHDGNRGADGHPAFPAGARGRRPGDPGRTGLRSRAFCRRAGRRRDADGFGDSYGQDPGMRGDRRQPRERQRLYAGHHRPGRFRGRTDQSGTALHRDLGRRTYAL